MKELNVFVSTACLPGMQSLASRLIEYRCCGLTDIELGAGVYVDGDVIGLLSNLEGRYLVHNYFPPPADPFVLNLASDNENIRHQSIELAFKALNLSAQLNAPFYSLHSGFITDPIGFDQYGFVLPMPSSPRDAQQAMERFIRTLGILIKEAENLGIQILIENNVCTEEAKGKLLLQTAEEFIGLFDALPSPLLGILLDTGHLNISAYTLGFKRMDFIEKVSAFIRAIHIHDNYGKVDTHDAIHPGSWVLDILSRPELANLPIVVESRFETVRELRQHVDSLKAELGQC